MSLEMLKAICAVEEDAREARLLVEQKAQDAINEAHKEGKDTIASTLERAESEITHLIRASDHKAMGDAMELASSTANRLATLRARAERRLDAAARLIVERIVNA